MSLLSERCQKRFLVVNLFVVLSLCICASSQDTRKIDTRIRNLIVAIHPEYETSDYRLSITGQRMIGLDFPVSDWFFSLEPYPPGARTGYVYNPTSTPCQKVAQSSPEGTCAAPFPDASKPVLIGRFALSSRGALAIEIAEPKLTERNEQFIESVPKPLKRSEIEHLLASAGARFPPSNKDSFFGISKVSHLAKYLRITAIDKPRFCLLARGSSSSTQTYPALYWMQVLQSQTARYVSIYEPFEGKMTVLLSVHDSSQIRNSCVE